jgi:hypothetical protein
MQKKNRKKKGKWKKAQTIFSYNNMVDLMWYFVFHKTCDGNIFWFSLLLPNSGVLDLICIICVQKYYGNKKLNFFCEYKNQNPIDLTTFWTFFYVCKKNKNTYLYIIMWWNWSQTHNHKNLFRAFDIVTACFYDEKKLFFLSFYVSTAFYEYLLKKRKKKVQIMCPIKIKFEETCGKKKKKKSIKSYWSINIDG